MIDFSIRIFINPKYSPSLIIGRLFVSNQQPEYVGALQKRFAWAIGFTLAITMFFLVVINNVICPINLFICLVCLILLLFESAFGICMGCRIYNFFNKEKAKLCPGGVCEPQTKEEIQKINFSQIGISVLFIMTVVSLPTFGIIKNNNLKNTATNQVENIDKSVSSEDISVSEKNDECEVPEWAIKIGHKEQYKLHHGCN